MGHTNSLRAGVPGVVGMHCPLPAQVGVLTRWGADRGQLTGGQYSSHTWPIRARLFAGWFCPSRSAPQVN